MKRSYDKTTSTKTFKKKKGVSKGDYQKGRELARTPKQELKAYDVAQLTTGFNTAGVFTCLNAPVNGSELYQRVGRKIYMKSIHIRGFIVNGTTSASQDMARIIVFFDSQPNAAAGTLAALLQDSNAGAATSGTSEINLVNRQRFKILRDYQMIIPPATNTAGVITNVGVYDQAEKTFAIDMFIKLKGLETVYNGTNGGTIADITSGSLFIVTLNNVAGNTGNWGFTFGTRLRYYD